MTKSKQPAQISQPQRPTIPPELALKRLEALLVRIPEVRAQGHNSPASSNWQSDAKIVLANAFGIGSLVCQKFEEIRFSPYFAFGKTPESEWVERFNSGLDESKGFLESRAEELREHVGPSILSRVDSQSDPNNIDRRAFVVHGHDHGNKEMVARFLAKLDIEPVILHEQADEGKTIIEKFEKHAAGAGVAVVILTADDIGSSKATPNSEELRARQNVVLELGYFVGKIGRHRTFALVESNVTLPSDIHGVVYIPLDSEGWRLRLVRELKAAGLPVDANRAFE